MFEFFITDFLSLFGNQQVHAPTSETFTTSGWQSICNDFPSTVNFGRLEQIHARVSWNQGVQIDHRSAAFPQESVVQRVFSGTGTANVDGDAHNLPHRIHHEGAAPIICPERSEICHHTIHPQKC